MLSNSNSIFSDKEKPYSFRFSYSNCKVHSDLMHRISENEISLKWPDSVREREGDISHLLCKEGQDGWMQRYEREQEACFR